MSDAVIGTEVDGYRIQAVLGRGGMGTVYKAEDVNLSRTVAIKRINPGQQERESFIHRFRSEAQALARIDSPQIVGVYALRETDIGLLIVMEYVEGGTLKDPLDRDGALPPSQAVPILEQTLEAFDDAHSAGVIHRDIKPENVMLTQDGMVKVTDFGIAKLRQPDSGETVTQGGQGGTLKYMSPEQISSIDDVDARSDVYSLGMTAYEMLAGDLPFEETDTDFDIMRKIVEGKIPPPDELNPEIPSGLAQWVVGAIQKEQDDRYQSAEEMKEALFEADRQSSEKTVTQPEWEVEGDDSDVDHTQTAVPGQEDRTQTVVPGGEEDVTDSGGQTVMDPDAGGATQPAVPDPDEAGDDAGAGEASVDEGAPGAAGEESERRESTGTNWAVVGGGVVGVLLLLVGGYVAVTQFSGAAGATLSLTTTPQGALVLVNGDTAGTTPINGYALKEAGPLMLKVRKKGYSPLDTTLTATAGTRVTLQEVTLAKAAAEERTHSTATLAENTQGSSDSAPSSSEPEPQQSDPASKTTSAQPSQNQRGNSEAGDDETASGGEAPTGLIDVSTQGPVTVLVDGEAQTASRSISLQAGEHTVTCRHQQHGSINRTVQVTEGETQSLSCYFERKVKVTALGAWGRIWLNRSNTGKDTPTTLSLPPGSHRIELRRKTLESFAVKSAAVKKTVRGGEGGITNCNGRTCKVEIEPGFSKVTYAVSFTTAGN